jgi:Tetratricopeptide repeat
MRRVLEMKRKLLGSDHPDTAVSASNLGVILHSLGRQAEAKALWLEAQVVVEKAYAADHPKVRMVHELLATA